MTNLVNEWTSLMARETGLNVGECAEFLRVKVPSAKTSYKNLHAWEHGTQDRVPSLPIYLIMARSVLRDKLKACDQALVEEALSSLELPGIDARAKRPGKS